MSDPSQIVAWRSRWQQVDAATDREIRVLSSEERFRILERLRVFARGRGIRRSADDEREVWERFEQLRAVARARARR